MTTPITVDVWSDIACPWCYIGKRRFESAVARFHGTVAVRYHSFQLSPELPADTTVSSNEFLAQRKGLAPEKADELHKHMSATAAAEGARIDFDRIRHTNTVRAHQLLHFAHERGRQDELLEVLFAAYFDEGLNVGDIDVLVKLAATAGLDESQARAALFDESYLAAVQADINQAQAYGISGVPFFVIDGKYGVSGAQDPAVFAEALRRVSQEEEAERVPQS